MENAHYRKLLGTVGAHGKNFREDVVFVQTQLKKLGFYGGPVNGYCDIRMVYAIKQYQSHFMFRPIGSVRPGSESWSYLVNPARGVPCSAYDPSAVVPSLVITGGNPNVGGGPYFPFATKADDDWNTGPRRFGAGRNVVDKKPTRSHAGCDLYAPVGRPIYSVDEGVVIKGPKHFYQETDYVAIKHDSFVVLYGEFKPGSCKLRIGDRVEAGQKIATVGKLEKIPKSMLHLEMYDGSGGGEFLLGRNVAGKMVNGLKTTRRLDLIDPTPYLNKWNLNKPEGY